MKYGDVLPEGFNIPKSAFWMRKDLEKNPFALLPLRRGDVVMDCGAYIGSFSAAALEQGAARAACYEASPKNAVLLRDNMARYGNRVRIVEKALVAGREASVALTLSGFSGANSILPHKNRPKHVEVRAANFRAELARLRPSVVKIDIEGAEYDILDHMNPGDLDGVQAIFIEFHPIEDREARILKIRSLLERAGLEIKSDRNRAFIATR